MNSMHKSSIGPQDIPFNVSYYFDTDLREHPESPEEMAAAVSFLQERLAHESDTYERMKISGWLGVYCRILNRLDEAEFHLNNALAASNALHDRRARVANLIRLAIVYQWHGSYHAADRILEQVIRACETPPDTAPAAPLLDYLDYAYQYLGKSKFDQGQYEAAAELFQKALQIRHLRGDPDLILNSQQALRVAHAHMGKH